MTKKIWSKPEISAVQFAANEYVSACSIGSTIYNFLCNLGGFLMFEATRNQDPDYEFSSRATMSKEDVWDTETYTNPSDIKIDNFLNHLENEKYVSDQLFYIDQNLHFGHIGYVGSDHPTLPSEDTKTYQGWFSDSLSSDTWQETIIWRETAETFDTFHAATITRANHSA